MWFIPGCAALCLFVCLPLYLHYRPLKPVLAACFKSMGTLCAMLPALIAALRLNPVFWFFAAALFLHAAADFLIDFRFEIGMGVFLLGHVCYLLAFLNLYPLTVAHLILLICFLSAAAYLLYRCRSRLGKSLLPVAVYSVVLSLMAACGIAGGATSYSLRGIITALGAALFFFSDGMVFRGLLAPQSVRSDFFTMLLYYLAQLMLGFSCLL